MKILHTSDWHIGRTLHGADLSAAHELFFADLQRIIRDEDVSVLLISGDILDRAVPSVQSLLLLESALEALSSQCQIIISPGNHDSAVRLGFLSSQLASRVRIVARDAQVGKAIEVSSAEGDSCLIYPLPYLEPDMWRVTLADKRTVQSAKSTAQSAKSTAQSGEENTLSIAQSGEENTLSIAPEDCLPRSHSAVMSAALQRISADLDDRHISKSDVSRPFVLVMAHAFVTGAAPSESERDISVGGVDNVPAEVMLSLGNPAAGADPRLDYMALGHLHRAQYVGDSQKLRYCGSPIPFSFSEANQHKTVTLITTDKEGLSSKEIALSTWRGLKRVSGSMETVLSFASQPDYRDAFVEVTVTDPLRPENFHQRIRLGFPHALIIRHIPENAHAESPAVTITPSTNARDLMGRFLRDMGGSDPTAEELSILTDAYDSARLEMGKR